MSNSSACFIVPQNFKQKNFVVPCEFFERQAKKGEDQKKNYQYRVFPQYNYGTEILDNGKVEKNIGSFSVFTDDITLNLGGIVTPDGEFRKTNDDCLSMWICVDEEHSGVGGAMLAKMFNDLDDDIEERIKTNPLFLYPKGQKEAPVKDLVLTRNVRPGKSKKDGKEFEWNRIKAVFDSEGETIDSTGEKCKRLGRLNRPFTVNYNDGTPDIIVETLEELKNHITWGSTIRYMLRIGSFWAMKVSKNVGKMQVRECGFKIFCDGVVIIKKREGGRRAQYKPMNDILAIANKMNKEETNNEEQKDKQKQPVEKVKANISDTDSSDSDSDSDKETTKKQVPPEKQQTKNPPKPKEVISDSNTDSSSDSEEAKKKEEEKKKVAAKKKPAKK